MTVYCYHSQGRAQSSRNGWGFAKEKKRGKAYEKERKMRLALQTDFEVMFDTQMELLSGQYEISELTLR